MATVEQNGHQSVGVYTATVVPTATAYKLSIWWHTFTAMKFATWCMAVLVVIGNWVIVKANDQKLLARSGIPEWSWLDDLHMMSGVICPVLFAAALSMCLGYAEQMVKGVQGRGQ